MFRIGDIVRLNSGGPRMIVVDIDGGSIVAAWYGLDFVKEAAFLPACIHHVDTLGGP